MKKFFYIEIDSSFYDVYYQVYYNGENFGCIMYSKGDHNSNWSYEFKHPITREFRFGFHKDFDTTREQMHKEFFKIKTDIEMNHETQMIHLKSLHLLPIIEND